MMNSIDSKELTEEEKREEEPPPPPPPPVVEPQSVSYIISKEGDKFLGILNKNSGNIELGEYIQSGGFASVFSIRNNQNLVCRITHTSLTDVEVRTESIGLGIQKVLASYSDNIVKIDEYGLYQVSNPEVANKYCKQIPRQDWCFLDENADQEKQQKEKNKIDAREKHFSEKYNEGIYAVMEKIESDLFDYSLDKLRKLHIEDTIEIIYAVFVQLMRVVSDIHYYGYVHRDIKPENIGIVFEEGKIKIKLFDFGFAVNTTELTKVRRVGTPGYYDNLLYKYDDLRKKLITPSRRDLEFSDVYACGISMFFMIAIILNEYKAFNYCIHKDYNCKDTNIIKFKHMVREKIVDKKKQKKLIGMLTIIQNCITDIDKVNKVTTAGRYRAAEILEQLQRLQFTSGGKKKSKKMKSKKKKTKKTKTNKKKTNKKKTKRI
jgi:serine/threonine protein kinase